MSHTLAVSMYRPKGEPLAVVEIIHGMAEHRKRYDEFARWLQEKGFAVVTYDLPGHGETAEGSPLGYFGMKDGWGNLVKSARTVAEECMRQYPDKPFFILGHSMGTMIARCYLQKYDGDLAGMILSGAPNYNSAAAAGITLATTIRGFKGPKGHSRLMDKMVTGNFNKSVQNPKTPVDWLSYSEENVQKYIADPLSGFPFTIQGYLDELQGMQQMADVSRYECRNHELPIYFFAGEEDPCIGGLSGLESSIETLRKAGYVNITSRLYPHMRHETLNEEDRLRVYEETAAWLTEQLNKPL